MRSAIILDTDLAASSISSYKQSIVFFVSGFGINFNVASVMMPNVPSEPINNWVKLYPATSLANFPPVRITSPLAKTTSSPRT